MRRITRDSVTAFLAKQPFNQANMTCDGETLRLHGNAIARWSGYDIEISNAGWESNTTKERLNGILEAVGYTGQAKICQRDFAWYWKSDNQPFPNNQWVTL